MDNYLINLSEALDVCSAYCPDDDGTCSKAGEDLRDMLDELESLQTYKQEQDWIKCSDRMPEVGQKVLVAWKRTVFTGTNHETTTKHMTTAVYDKCKDTEADKYGQLCWIHPWDGEPIYSPISHWMPMPDFPVWEE